MINEKQKIPHPGYHTIRTVPISNEKIIERGKNNTPNNEKNIQDV